MIDSGNFTRDCLAVRDNSPLVLNITNYVAMNFTANVLLAAGASPMMTVCRDEVEELVARSSALVLNIGCLDAEQTALMRTAAAAAARLGKPWVLDPVGAGASRLRTETSLSLISESGPAVIRCNASEIMALAGEKTRSRGVDAACTCEEALESAKMVARRAGAVVSVSGPVDHVTDGIVVETIANGDALMPRVTAMGCAATALTGAFLAVDKNAFDAALHAMAMMGLAGEKAAKDCPGPGSFAVRFIDEIGGFVPQHAAKLIRQ